MFDRYSCSSLFSKAKLNHEKIKSLNEEYMKLPSGARDNSLIPITPAAISDRKKAEELDQKITAISLESEKIYEQVRASECFRRRKV